MHVIVLLFSCCLFLLPSATAAQRPIARLIKVKSLMCYFGPGSIGEWKNGNGIVEVKKAEWNVSIHFDNINLETQQARQITSIYAINVTAMLTEAAVTFIGQISPRNFFFTTVFDDYKQGTKDFIAVISSHRDFFGPMAFQYHGT